MKFKVTSEKSNVISTSNGGNYTYKCLPFGLTLTFLKYEITSIEATF